MAPVGPCKQNKIFWKYTAVSSKTALDHPQEQHNIFFFMNYISLASEIPSIN